MTRRRLAVTLALLALGTAVAGCGEDEHDDDTRAQTERAAHLTLEEARSVIERGELAVISTGRDTRPSLKDAGLTAAERYETQSGREFELLVFAEVRDAERARPAVAELEGAASVVRTANVLAVFPEDHAEVDAFAAAVRGLQRLRAACAPGGSGDERLQRLCFSGDGGVPPPGEGVDRDEAQEQERPVVVDGLHYDPALARRLNPNIRPDEALLSGRRASDGKRWFGVFLRVCNEGDTTRTAASRLALVNAFGDRVEPSDALPADNPFGYEPRPVEPDDCLPAEGAVADRVNDGALVPFEVTREFLTEFPLALEVSGASGRRERVVVGL